MPVQHFKQGISEALRRDFFKPTRDNQYPRWETVFSLAYPRGDMSTYGYVMTDDQSKDHERVSEETYLAMDMASNERHEYIDGFILAMAGESQNHNIIAMNLATFLKVHLRTKPCRPFLNGIKVRAADNIYYPDVVVDCSEVRKGEYFANNPILIVEVLSSSTRKNDVTTKLVHYINLPSLQEYVLVEQDVVRVHVLRKANQWRYEEFTVEDAVDFGSIGLTIPVVEIYEDVDNADIAAYRTAKENITPT